MGIVAFWVRPTTPSNTPADQATQQTTTQASSDELPALPETMLNNFTTSFEVAL